MTDYKIIQTINGPEDVKKLSMEQLEELASEIREALFNRLTKSAVTLVQISVWWRQRLPCIMFSLRLRISLYLMYLIRAILIRF